MAFYDLNGAGVQGITSGTTRLFVEVLVFPVGYSTGRAAPTNYFDVALIRPGVQGAFAKAIPVDATDIFIDLPDGCDSFGYSVFDPGTIRVSESTPAPPDGATLTVTSADVPPGDGSTVTIAWAGIPTQLTDDYLTIVPASMDSGHFDNNVMMFSDFDFLFATNCDAIFGSSPPAATGSCTSNLVGKVASGTAVNARYRRFADDSDVVISGTWNLA